MPHVDQLYMVYASVRLQDCTILYKTAPCTTSSLLVHSTLQYKGVSARAIGLDSVTSWSFTTRWQRASWFYTKEASSSSVALPLTSIGKCTVFRFSCRKSIFAFSLAASEVFTSMMVQCFVPDCNYQSERDACGVYRFPKDPEEKKKWIKLIA